MSAPPRDRRRATEGSLLFFVILILASGFLLVFLARTRGGLPKDSVNVNTATAEELAVALDFDPALAKRLVGERQRLGGFVHVDQLKSVSVFTAPEERSRATALVKESGVDINRESASGLERLLGVPREVARRIVAFRDSLPEGRFSRPVLLLRTTLVSPDHVQAAKPRLVARGPMTIFFQFLGWGIAFLVAMVLVTASLRRAGTGGDPFLLPVTFLLAGLGAILLFSIKDPLRDTPVHIHHLRGILLGSAAMWLAARLSAPARRGMRRYTYVWALASMGLMILLMLFGAGPEGVRLSVFGFQPVEVIKLLLVFFVAGYLADRADLLADVTKKWRPALLKDRFTKFGIAWPRAQDLGPVVGMFAAALLLFLVVRDMGPALVLFGAFIATMYIATGRSGILIIGVGMMTGGMILGTLLRVGVLPVRVAMWQSPWSNPYPNGMQLGQALWGMGSGGTWGSGLGLGAPGEMSRPGSDLMFASVAEELGLIGAMFVLVCFCVLIWRSLRAALEARSDFDRLLAVGLTTLLACQVFLITAGVSGLLPLSGIALPFVSFGNSALVSGFFLIGLLRGISAPAGKEDAAEVRPLFRRTVAQFATAAVVGLIGLVGVARLAWVQGVLADQTAGRLVRTPDADRVVRAKVNPRLTGIERSIRRGSIYDREGRVLATSRLDEISAAVGGDAAKVRRLAGKGRYYPRGADLAHLVGYADPGVGGPAGLEREFNSDLRGFDSYSELLQDYRAKDLPVWWPAALGGRPRREARDVVLTIDADLQRAALRILRERAGKTGRAAMTVLDPATGEVLVSVAIPNYDPNTLTPDRFRTLSADADKTHPLLDRSRFGYYPPGSTLKVATGGIGLEEGVEHSVNCQHALRNSRWTHGGEVYFRRQILDDRTDPPHGPTRMHEGLRVSCNVYFASLGLALGPERLYHGFADADRWAFSRVQPLPGFAAELPTSAFGQGTMLATPTEMARVAAAVANRGQMMRPVLWKQTRTRDGETVRAAAPDLMSRPLGEANAAAMAEMMRSVVTGGTARGVFEELPVEVAGKTGTAQTESGNKQPHSWFIGYAPYTKPSYAFSCVIENGGYGKRGAAPALRDILAEVYRRGGG